MFTVIKEATPHFHSEVKNELALKPDFRNCLIKIIKKCIEYLTLFVMKNNLNQEVLVKK